jgi:hypothetical protein
MTSNSPQTCQSTADPVAVLADVCTLDDARRAARWQVVERFIATAVNREALPNGLRCSFARDGETARHIIEFIQVERACCSRFSYAFEEGPEELLSLLIRASAADVPALHALYLRPRLG